MKPPVVFVCTGNCIRSQMAEGLLRDRLVSALAGKELEG